jgi:hypothetical protein
MQTGSQGAGANNGPLESSTLIDNLNAACYVLTDAFIKGSEVLGILVPGLPTSGLFDEFIPGLVLDLAVNAGWIPRPEEPDEDYGIAFGKFYVRESFRDWFMKLMDDSLSDLRQGAARNDEDLEASRLRKGMWEVLSTYRAKEALAVQGIDFPEPQQPIKKIGGRARQIIDEFFRLSDDIFKHFELAHKASPKRRKIDGGCVNAVHISRIYNGQYVGPEVRQAVAEVLNEKVPCTRDDLLPPDWTDKRSVKSNETA